MRSLFLAETLRVLWGFTLFVCVGGVFADEPAAERIEQLIKQLDSNQFEVRESASAGLIIIGDAAEPQLTSALAASPSGELRRRGNDILLRIKLNRIARSAVSTEDFVTPLKSVNQKEFDKVTYEARLQRLVDILVIVTGDERLKVPVIFDRVEKMDGRFDEMKRRRLVLRDSYSGQVERDSVVLADYAVNTDIAMNCVIVARYGVQVGNCMNCIIIAGHSVRIADARDSIILCGGESSIDRAERSILCTPKLTCRSAEVSRFINCDPMNARIDDGKQKQDAKRRYDTPGIVLSPPPPPGPLPKQITITFAKRPRKPQEHGFALFQMAGSPGEYVVREGGELKSPGGTSLPGLDGWALRYSGDTFVVFSDGERESWIGVSDR